MIITMAVVLVGNQSQSHNQSQLRGIYLDVQFGIHYS